MGANTIIPEIQPRDAGNSTDWQSSSAQQYERQAKTWLEAAFEEARHDNLKNEEVAKMSTYIDYFMGKQWSGQRPTYRSRPVDNRIWRLIWELVGLLTDVRPLFEIKSLRSDYTDQAEILNKTTRSWWMEADADLTLSQIVIYGLLSTGFGKIEWNPTLRNGEGDFDFIAIGPNNGLPLKAKTGVNSGEAFIYQEVKPLQWFRVRYPLRGSLVRADSQFSRYDAPLKPPSSMSTTMFNNLSPGFQSMMAGNPKLAVSYYPMALYREFWMKDYTYNSSRNTIRMGTDGANWSYMVKPGDRLYPRGRLICMGGPEILYDGPNPYWHGKFPFEALRMNVVPWMFHGASEFRPLMDMQDIINNILAGVMDMVKKAINPPFVAPSNAFSDAVWNAMDWSMPGAKARYNAASAHAPSWASPPSLPSFVLQILTLAAREMDESSGIATVAQAIQKKQVPAADTLESIKQTQQTPIRLKGRNMEVFLRRMGSMNIANTFQFYDAKRRMFMLGPDGLTLQDFDYDPDTMVPAGTRPEDHIHNFVFMIQPGTLLNIAQQEKGQILMALRKGGDMDRKHLLENLDLGISSDSVESNLKEEVQNKLIASAQLQKLQQDLVAQLGIVQPQQGSPAGGGQ